MAGGDGQPFPFGHFMHRIGERALTDLAILFGHAELSASHDLVVEPRVISTRSTLSRTVPPTYVMHRGVHAAK